MGDVVQIEGAYVRGWRGLPQLTFDDTMEVAKLKKGALPPLEELEKGAQVSISNVAKRGGACRANIDGVVLDIRSGSGLVFRCPECRRVLQKNICRIHGEMEGQPDLRIKAVVDDGTGALTVIMGSEITESILGMDLDGCQKKAKEAMDQEVIADMLYDMLVARPIKVAGDVTSDDFGLMMVAQSQEFTAVDVKEEARALLDEVEGW